MSFGIYVQGLPLGTYLTVELLSHIVCIQLLQIRPNCFPKTFFYLYSTSLRHIVLLATTSDLRLPVKTPVTLHFMSVILLSLLVPTTSLHPGQLDIPALSPMTWAFSSSLPLTDIYNYPRRH